MTETIPNELLGHILAHALIIPAAVFEAWQTHRTYCGSTPSDASSILLVSKRWCTLGTPSLYESAILRTAAQVQALAQTLTDRRDRQRTLSHYLRRLRIGGGFGSALIKILSAASHITTLHLGFDLTNKDSMAGLIKALKKVNLEHLLLDSVDGLLLSNPTAINLSKAIAGALPHWKKLKQVDTSPMFVFLPEVLPALTKVPALEWISMSIFTMKMNIDGNVLAALARNPSVKNIQIRALETSTPVQLLQCVDESARSKVYVGVGKEWTSMVKLTEFPEVEVMKEVPDPLSDLPDKLWDRIIDYATRIETPDIVEHRFGPFQPSTVNRTRKAILLVDRRFNRLGLRHMYNIPHLTRDSSVDRFITIIEENHNLARLVRVLDLPKGLAFKKQKHVLAPLTSLERVTSHFIVFPDIAPFVQDGEPLPLLEASQWLAEGLVDLRLFKPFVKLQSLSLMDEYGAIAEKIPHDAFPKLESLDLSGWNLIDKFTQADLPSLRTFGFEAAAHTISQATRFLEVHGHKLRTLSVAGAFDPQPGQPRHALLDLCPDLIELRIMLARAPSSIPFLEHSQAHANIERLVFPSLVIDRALGVSVDPSWDLFVEQLRLHRSKLPALKEFCVPTPFYWPVNYLEYQYFALTPLIDDLHALGITFMDASGTRWTRFEPSRSRWHGIRGIRSQPAVAGNQEDVGSSLHE